MQIRGRTKHNLTLQNYVIENVITSKKLDVNICYEIPRSLIAEAPLRVTTYVDIDSLSQLSLPRFVEK